MSTDPPAGTQVNKLTTISLSVGTGPATVTVPRLIGLGLADATTELTNAGLKVGTQTQTEGEADQVGKVIASTPEPGTKVGGASLVNIAIGVQATTVPIPNVQGQDAGDAQRALESAGFKVTKDTVDGGGDSGSVVGTYPPAGTKAKRGSTVTLQISSGDKANDPCRTWSARTSGWPRRCWARPGSPTSARAPSRCCSRSSTAG